MKISADKKYRTFSEKYPVTIVSTDGPFPGFPVVGYVHSTRSTNPLLCHWSVDGGYPANNTLNLVETREPREFWVNVYPDSSGTPKIHPSKEAADTHASGGRIEVIRVREVLTGEEAP